MTGKNGSQEIKLPKLVTNQTTTVTKGGQLVSVLESTAIESNISQ